MVQLKQVLLRLKSIKNIQKITKTMKMVSASKFTRAERELKAARPFGYAPRKFYQTSGLFKSDVDAPPASKEKAAPTAAVPGMPPEVPARDPSTPENKAKKIFIAVTSDRGMCGAVHSGVARRIRREMAPLVKVPEVSAATKIVCLGDKSRSMLRPGFPTNILVTAKNIGRASPVFADAANTAAAVADALFEYEYGEIYFNKYHTPVKYELTVIPFFTKAKIEAAPNINAFDDLDDDELTSYSEWTLAALLYYAFKEGAASELSARMAAMDNATNNASDMIRKLTLLFNRTRQAVITRELIEIISGAAALK